MSANGQQAGEGTRRAVKACSGCLHWRPFLSSSRAGSCARSGKDLKTARVRMRDDGCAEWACYEQEGEPSAESAEDALIPDRGAPLVPTVAPA